LPLNELFVACKRQKQAETANGKPVSHVLCIVRRLHFLAFANWQLSASRVANKISPGLLEDIFRGQKGTSFWRRATKFSLLSAKLNVIVIFNFKCSTNGEKKILECGKMSGAPALQMLIAQHITHSLVETVDCGKRERHFPICMAARNFF